MAKVTIDDISRQTNLSRGTVSRALNDRPDISEKTKKRVLEACRKLNYSPSHAARSLATGRTYAVAVLVDDLQDPFVTSLLQGVIRRASEAHYVVNVIERTRAAQTAELQIGDPDRFDALINAAALNPAEAGKLRDTIEKRVLSSCVPLDGVSCDVFAPDYFEAGRLAARVMSQGNAREILFVRRTADSGSEELLGGFREVCQARGLDPDRSTITVDDSADALAELAGRLGRAEAIVATSDALAISAIMSCEPAGRRPGTDFAIMGIGNRRIGADITPSLTTVDMSGEEIGRRNMDAILQRLDRLRMDSPQAIRVAPLLVERDSTHQLAGSTR